MSKEEEEESRKAASVSAMAVEMEKVMPDERIKIWLEKLSKYTPEQVEAAADHFIMHGKFFPRLAEFIAQMEGTGNADAVNDAALAGWWAVIDALRSGRIAHVYSADPSRRDEAVKALNDSFSDQRIVSTIRLMGGWYRLRVMGDAEMPFREKEFVEAYKASRRIDAAPLPLPPARLKLDATGKGPALRDVSGLLETIGKGMR